MYKKSSTFFWFSAALVVLATLGSPVVHAELTDEIQVYTDEINEPGEFGLELHVNATPKGRSKPDYPGEVTPHHGLRITPEFSFGLTKTLEAGLYLPLVRDESGNTSVAGAKLRLKWLPVKPADGQAGWFLGANGELSRLEQRFSESRSSFELRLIVGWHNDEWLIGLNPVFGWSLDDGLRNNAPDFSLNVKAARTVAKGIAVGMEYYAGLGTTEKFLPYDQQARTLYLALDAKIRRWDLNFGIGRGLTSGADDWTVKAIIGVPF